MLMSLSAGAWAQTPFTASSLTITENFNSLPASGSPTFTQNGTISSVYGERTGSGTTIIANDGSGTAGGLYSYGTGTTTDRALGSIGSSNAAAGNFTYGYRLKNNTGSTITSLRVQYTGEQWRTASALGNTIPFSYLISSAAITTTTPTAALPTGYVAVPSLDLSNPVSATPGAALNGNSSTNQVLKDFTITGLSIPDGSEIMLRWYDIDHSGSDHGLAIDDLTIAATATPAGSTLTASPATLSGFSTPVGTPSPVQTYTIAGSSLTADVQVTAPAGFQVSQDGSTFADNLTVTQSGGAANAVVRVRLTGVVIGAFTGNITNTSTGATTQNVAVSGNTVDPNAPTLSVMPGALSGFSTTQGTASAPKSAFVMGSNLSPSSYTASVSTGYEISLSGPPSYSNQFTFNGLPNSFTSEIAVRLANTAATGPQSGTLLITGSNNTSAVVTLSGTVSSTASGITFISAIQGTGTSAALTGTQTIEGIVTRAFPGSTALAGFYVQEEDADSDNNPLTSEGIFVYDPSNLFTGNVGDKVQVVGTVSEFTSVGVTLTQITPTTVQNLGASPLPTATPLLFPVANVADLERYEGMLVTASAGSGSLVVTEYFELGRYGSVVLSSGGLNNVAGTDNRLDQYTQFYAPNVSGYAAYLADNARRSIVLDDASGVQNPANIILGRLSNPLSASNTLRGGDAVSGITTILDHRFGDYRLQTATGINFQPTNPRPTTPPSVGAATLKVASFNILNYFNDLTISTSTRFTNCNGNSIAPRGANTAQEFTRQRDKTIQAIVQSGVDVMGLNEMENNGFGPNSAIQDLIDGLNAVAGAGSFTFINSGCISSDAITVAIIYRPANVTPAGASAAIPFSYGSGAFTAVGRRALAQTFQQNSNSEVFTVVANHWKSKGSSAGGAGDTDANDGQAASNGTRTRQAQDVVSWLNTKPTGTNDPDYVILGDLNAYAQEDPLTTLYAAGYTNLVPNTTYSYVFDGQVGALDHGLRSASLQNQISGADKWHINADEPNYLDYNVTITNTVSKTPAQVISLYAPDQFRTSDHDPVIIGLALGSTCAGGMITVKAGAWNDPTVWSCNRVPLATDAVTVKHMVTMPAGYLANAKSLLLDVNGKLSYDATGRLQLNP